MSIYSVNILSVCLSVMLQKALLLMDVVILVLLVFFFQSPFFLFLNLFLTSCVPISLTLCTIYHFLNHNHYYYLSLLKYLPVIFLYFQYFYDSSVVSGINKTVSLHQYSIKSHFFIIYLRIWESGALAGLMLDLGVLKIGWGFFSFYF